MVKICKNNIFNFFEYIIAISFLLHCSTMWSYIPEIRGIFSGINYFFLLIGTVGCILLSLKKIIANHRRTRNTFISVFALIAYFFVYYIVTSSNLTNIFRFATAWILLFAYFRLSKDKHNAVSVLGKYKKMVVLVAVVSIIFWIFGSQFGVIRPSSEIYSDWSDRYVNSYMYLYFEPQYIHGFWGSSILVRNSAIFTEAPMCALAFCTALLVELFLEKKTNLFVCGVLTIGILTTISGTGYIVLILAYYFYFILSNKKGIFYQAVRVFLVFLSFGVVIGLYYILANRVTSLSGNIRIDDLKAGIQAWKEKLIFGNGIYNLSAIQKHMSSFRSYNVGFSNSIFQILSDGGIYLFGLYLVSGIKGIMTCLIKKDTYGTVFIILVIVLFALVISSYFNLTMCVFIMMSLGFLHSKRS